MISTALAWAGLLVTLVVCGSRVRPTLRSNVHAAERAYDTAALLLVTWLVGSLIGLSLLTPVPPGQYLPDGLTGSALAIGTVVVVSTYVFAAAAYGIHTLLNASRGID